MWLKKLRKGLKIKTPPTGYLIREDRCGALVPLSSYSSRVSYNYHR